ncbi:MAG: response regulator [Lachnospiraceae bacterium]|nr:response regulator [Lachnospiraceae bacterium]
MAMRVMLVDDEPFILQGLSRLIDWEREGCEVVKTAADGQEAIEYLAEGEADLIITDIRMPRMNGIELLEHLRAEKISDAYVVILSGYSDFKYAQAAIRYEAMEYLLKPVQKEQLLGLVRKVAENRAVSRQEELDTKKMQRGYLLQNLSVLLQGRTEEQRLSYVREHFRCTGGVRYLHICLNDLAALEEMTDEEVVALKDAVYECAASWLQEDADHLLGEFFAYEEEYELGFLYCEHMAAKRNLSEGAFMRAFHQALQNGSKNMPVILLLGKWVEDIAKISHSYSSACVLRSFKGFQERQNVFYYEKEVQVGEAKPILCGDSLDALVKAVEAGDSLAINKSVDALFTEMDRLDRTRETVVMNLNWLIFRLLSLAMEQDESVSQDEVLSFISGNVSKEEIIRGSRAHLRKFAGEYAEYLAQLKKNISGGILQEIECEIRERYAENLTLRELGQKYYINSSYLGQIFRKRYGQSFKSYLNTCRISEAALQLVRTDKKIGEIAEDVGYHDLDYFISRFIEQEGCTPSRYRKQARERQE